MTDKTPGSLDEEMFLTLTSAQISRIAAHGRLRSIERGGGASKREIQSRNSSSSPQAGSKLCAQRN
jgi:hypothetical protein